jgi:hypothetical protein
MTILLAAVISSIVGILIDWVVTIKVFHRFRRRTPATYRNLSRHMLVWAAIVIAAFTYSGFFAITGGVGWLNVRQWVQIGVLFGVGCWAALPLPLLLSLSVFINLHRGVVIGLLLEWLLISVAFGVVCSAVTVR